MRSDSPPMQAHQPKSVSEPLNKPRCRAKQRGVEELVPPSSQHNSKSSGADITNSEATDYESSEDWSVEAGNVICFKCFTCTRSCNQCTCCTVTTTVVVSVVVFVIILISILGYGYSTSELD